MIPTNQSPVTNLHALAYVGLIVAGAMLAAIGQQMAAGNVPIPAGWAWLSPVLIAGIISLTTMLPKVTDTPGATLPPAAPAVPPLAAPPPTVNANPAALATVAYTPSPLHQASVVVAPEPPAPQP